MGKASDKPIKFVLIRNYLEEKYHFRFNSVAIDLEYKQIESDTWETLNPSDLECELFLEGFTGFEKQLSALLKSSSFVPVYDPIRNYFETLPPWDQQTDYISQYAGYVKTTDQPFFWSNSKK